MHNEIQIVLKNIKKNRPLILNLTNVVSMDFVANVLLAVGAVPLMTVCMEELEELVQIADCININIGTLDPSFIILCESAMNLAKQYQKPIVFDPVGVGASLIRTQTAKKFVDHASIIKGNASEIIFLEESHHQSLGVETNHTIEEAKCFARKLSKTNGCTTVVTGPIDFVTNGTEETNVPFGSHLMTRVTGMGCALSALISAFRSVFNHSFESARLATIYYGLCGQQAALKTQSPGTFRQVFIDALYSYDFT